MKTIKNILLLTPILLFLSGCEKDFLEISDPNNIDNAVFWTSEKNATSAVNAIYSSIKEPGFLGLDYHKYASFISGEYDRCYPSDQSRVEFMTFTVKSENKIDWLIWKDLFRDIMRSNDVITHVSEMNDELISQEAKDQLVGQAYFLRGFCELYLLQMYGAYYPEKDTSALGIPLITRVAQSREEMFCKRASVGESYKQIIADFEEAEKRLPSKWDNTNLGRATKGAAIAYAATTHMWLNQFDKAIASYDKLFALGLYSLIDDFSVNFHGKNENNSESIFELQYADFSSLNPWVGGSAQSLALEFAPSQLGRGNAGVSYETSDYFALSYTITQAYLDNSDTKGMPNDMYAYISSLKGKTVSPEELKNNLISQFDVTTYVANMTPIYKWIEGTWDPRWKATAFIQGDTLVSNEKWTIYSYSTSFYSPKKFIDSDRHALNTGGTLGANESNIPLFRLAYAYLQYAEALNETGKTTEAVDYINKVRERAYKGYTGQSWKLASGLSKEQIKAALELENFRELCGECVRWKDLVRWGVADKYCSYRGFEKGTHEVLPIPKAELDLNPNMEQNENY